MPRRFNSAALNDAFPPGCESLLSTPGVEFIGEITDR
jgi:hypothetical protein